MSSFVWGRSHRAAGAPHTGNDGAREYDRVLASTTTSTRPLGRDDARLSVPLFTLRESAAYLRTPVSTLHAWAHPNDGEPLVTVFPRAGRRATVPGVGFAEAFVLGALRGAGLMQRIRPAVAKLSDEIGLDHALASQRVYTDGAELIFDYAAQSDDKALLTVVRTGQQHFVKIIRDYLKRITYGDDGWAERLRLPAYARAEVTVDPRQAFGQPLVVHGGARVEDLVDRFQAGDGFAEIADDFGVPAEEVEDVKDAKIRYRPSELQVVIDHGLRAFCLTNANLRGVEMAERFVDNLARIVRIAEQRPGPYIFGVYSDAVRPLWPK